MLKQLRIFIPGLLLVVLLMSVVRAVTQANLDIAGLFSSLRLTDTVVFPVAAYFLGGIYYLSDIRMWFLRGSKHRIDSNIRRRLVEFCKSDPRVGGCASRLVDSTQLLGIFFHVVDKDTTLTEKAKNVYLNGLVWSTTADVMAVSLFGGAAHLTIYLIAHKPGCLTFALGMGLLYLLFWRALLPKVTDKHIKLSNEQLDYIGLNFKDELCAKIAALAETGIASPHQS